MTLNSKMTNTPQQPVTPPSPKPPGPVENTGFTVEGSVKIFDPESGQVYLEKRI